MSQVGKRNVTNVAASLLGYAVPLVVNFVSIPYLMKSLGEDAFGIQVLVNVVIGYLALMDMGIGLPLIKYLAEDKAKGDMKSASELLSTTLVLYLGLGIFGMLVAFAVSDYLAESFFSIPNHLVNEAEHVFQLAAAGFFATLLMGWGRSVAMGLQRYEVAYSISALSSVLGVGVGLYLIYAGFGVVGYVFSKVLFLFIAALVYFFIYRVFIPEYKIKLRFNKISIVRIKSYLAYGIVHRGVSGLAGSIDKTLLGMWVSVASVGLYSLPFMLTNAINYTLSFMLSFIFPASSELYVTGQHDRLRGLFLNSSRFLVAATCMIFLPFFLMGGAFLTLWLGGAIEGKVLVAFYLLALASFIQVLLTSLTNCVMLGIGRVDQFTIYTVIRLIAFTFLCALLIPMFDIVGAAWAVLLVCMVDAIYFVLVVKEHLKINIFTLFVSAYLRPLLISLCLGLLLFPFHSIVSSWLDLSLTTVVIEVAVMILYYYFNVFRDSEKELVRNAFARGLRIR
ncbi:MAG TPA: hypothetical protein ENI67_06400 [Gammaproteobacteria bacterium]|nr:hypothetical protein [Gammaproteobacteria bacterium]